MTWERLTAGFLAHLRGRGRRPRTLQLVGKYLAKFARYCGERQPDQVWFEDLALYHRTLTLGRQLYTADTMVVPVRGLFRWAIRERLLLIDPTEGLCFSRSTTRPVRVLTPDQVAVVLELPDPETASGLRDLALMETFYGTGLRLEECRLLDLADLDLRHLTLDVREGKGGRPRQLPLGPHLQSVLRSWLERGRPAFRSAAKSQAVFLSPRGRIGRSLVGKLVADYGARARLGPLSPHRLRHAFAVHLIEGGADLRHVQALLGHNVLRTTQIYTQIRPVELFREFRRCHPRARRKSGGPQLHERTRYYRKVAR